MIRILGTILAGLLGLAFGSFLNVCLSRWPEGESVVHPRSHCRNCARTLSWWENVPLISWIALRGRCRKCKTKISCRYPLVELAVGILWALVAWRSLPADFVLAPSDVVLPLALIGLSSMVFLWLLVALAILDLEHLWLPNKLTIPGTVAGFVVFILYVLANSKRVLEFYGALSLRSRILWHAAGERILAILVAGGIILLIRWTYWLIRRREGIGLGDAKLMALLGAWLGLSGALLSFAIGILLGAFFALIVLAVPAGRRGSETWLAAKMPLGTFLCIGGIISALWGQPLITAYVHLVGL
jgi:leader peptidase (prepilin peptidase) / N-methyltransferase